MVKASSEIRGRKQMLWVAFYIIKNMLLLQYNEKNVHTHDYIIKKHRLITLYTLVRPIS